MLNTNKTLKRIDFSCIFCLFFRCLTCAVCNFGINEVEIIAKGLYTNTSLVALNFSGFLLATFDRVICQEIHLRIMGLLP